VKSCKIKDKVSEITAVLLIRSGFQALSVLTVAGLAQIAFSGPLFSAEPGSMILGERSQQPQLSYLHPYSLLSSSQVSNLDNNLSSTSANLSTGYSTSSSEHSPTTSSKDYTPPSDMGSPGNSDAGGTR
jgi:hypothetical protein